MDKPTTAEGWQRLAQKMSNRAEIQPSDRAGMKLAVGYSRRSIYAWRQAIALERKPIKFITIAVSP